jgi:hypothetical protein
MEDVLFRTALPIFDRASMSVRVPLRVGLSISASTLIVAVFTFVVLSYSFIGYFLSIAFGLVGALLLSLFLINEDRFIFRKTKELNCIVATVQRSNLIFIALYIGSLICVFAIPGFSNVLYVNPLNISFVHYVRFAAGFLLTSFFPGYVLGKLSGVTERGTAIIRLVISYLLSIFLSSLFLFLSLALGYKATSVWQITLVVLNVPLIIAFFAKYGRPSSESSLIQPVSRFRLTNVLFFVGCGLILLIWVYLTAGSQIIGDAQVFHGLAIQIIDGSYPSYGGIASPPLGALWFQIYLADLFLVSGIPSVNAYSLLTIVNLVSLLSFYDMTRKYIGTLPATLASATFLAFFTGGFDWIYGYYVTHVNAISNAASLLNLLVDAGRRTMGIYITNSQFLAQNPSITTPYYLVWLPVLFTFVALLPFRFDKMPRNHIMLLTILVIMSWFYEGFALFLFVFVSVLMAFRMVPRSVSYALISGISLVGILDFISPARFYTASHSVYSIFGLTIFDLGAIISLLSLGISFLPLNEIHLAELIDRRLVRLIILGTLAWFYIVASIYWLVTPIDERAYFPSIPWFVYPLRLGLVGLLALISIFYFGFQKHNLVYFWIWALLAIVEGLFSDAASMSKYLLIGLAPPAAFMLSKIITSVKDTILDITPRRDVKGTLAKISGPIFIGIVFSLIVVAGIGGPLFNVAFTQAQVATGESIVQMNGIPVNPAMFQSLNFIKENAVPWQQNIAEVPNGPDNFYSYVVRFSGTAQLAFPQMFQISTPDEFYDSVQSGRVSYLYLPRQYQVTGYPYYSPYGVYNVTASSFLSDFLDYATPAFNNSVATVYDIPSYSPPSSLSDLVLVQPAIRDYDLSAAETSYFFPSDILSSAHANYTVFLTGDPNQWAEKTLILPYDPVQFATNFTNCDPSTFWSDAPGGSGSLGAAALTPSVPSTNPRGESAKVVIGQGNYAWNDLVSDFSPPLNLSLAKYVTLDWYGTDSGITHYVALMTKTSAVRIPFVDDFTGWRQLVLPVNGAAGGLSSVGQVRVFLQNQQGALFVGCISFLGDLLDDSQYLHWAQEGGNLVVLQSNGFGSVAKLLGISSQNQSVISSSINGPNSTTILPQIPIPRLVTTPMPYKVLSYYHNSEGNQIPFSIQYDYGSGKITYVFIQPIFSFLQSTKNKGLFNEMPMLLSPMGISPITTAHSPGTLSIPDYAREILVQGNILLDSSSLFPLRINASIADFTNASQVTLTPSPVSTGTTVTLMRNVDFSNLTIAGPVRIHLQNADLRFRSGVDFYFPIDIQSGSRMTVDLSKSTLTSNLTFDGQRVALTARGGSVTVVVNTISPFSNLIYSEFSPNIANLVDTTSANETMILRSPSVTVSGDSTLFGAYIKWQLQSENGATAENGTLATSGNTSFSLIYADTVLRLSNWSSQNSHILDLGQTGNSLEQSFLLLVVLPSFVVATATFLGAKISKKQFPRVVQFMESNS